MAETDFSYLFKKEACIECHKEFTSIELYDVAGKLFCSNCKKKKEEMERREKFVAEIMAGDDLRESVVKLANLLYDLQNRKPTYVPPPIFK